MIKKINKHNHMVTLNIKEWVSKTSNRMNKYPENDKNWNKDITHWYIYIICLLRFWLGDYEAEMFQIVFTVIYS